MVRRTDPHDKVSSISSTASDGHFDRKKQLHLRCERQRREAINNGYQDLKDLIPQSPAIMGCKTTNAAILFRAVDHMNALTKECQKGEKDVQTLQSQLSALEMIAEQYGNMTVTPAESSASMQAKMMQLLMDSCFETFVQQVDFSSYATITRTLLTWVESLGPNNEHFKRTASSMVTFPFTNK